ncbi:MAG: hypothetical protein ACPG4N_12130, partial [Gammaproteobacteria bacterium]
IRTAAVTGGFCFAIDRFSPLILSTTSTKDFDLPAPSRATLARALAKGTAVIGLAALGALRAETANTDIPPIWDENGYPIVVGPDRIEEWRPESFFRLFYDGELGSSHDATGLEDFGYYDQRRSLNKNDSDTPEQDGADQHQAEPPLSAPPAKQPLIQAAFLDQGRLLAKITQAESGSRRLQLTQAGNPANPAMIDLPAPWRGSDLIDLEGAIAHTPEGDWLLNTGPFQLTVVRKGGNETRPVRELSITSPIAIAKDAGQYGVVALDGRRALLWATRDRPIPYSVAIVVDTMNGSTLREIPLKPERDRWSRVTSVFRTMEGGIYYHLLGSDDSLLDPQVSLFRLDAESGSKDRLFSVSADIQGYKLWRLLPGQNGRLTAIYLNAKKQVLIHSQNADGTATKNQLPQAIQAKHFPVSPEGDQLLLVDQSGHLWWLLLNPRLALIQHGRLAESDDMLGLRLLNDGDFETLSDSGIKRHSSLIPGALARLGPFISFMEQLELGITNGGFRALEQAVIGDPDFAARGFALPQLPWLDLSTVLARVYRDGDPRQLQEFGRSLVNIIDSYTDSDHPGKEQALTLYALMARSLGHPVLARQALQTLPPGERHQALLWALGEQAETVPDRPISTETRRWLGRWINRFPEAFSSAIETNRAKLLYVLRDFELPRRSTPRYSPIDFPDLAGRMIRARDRSMDSDGNQSPIRLLNAQ